MIQPIVKTVVSQFNNIDVGSVFETLLRSHVAGNTVNILETGLKANNMVVEQGEQGEKSSKQVKKKSEGGLD